MIIINNNTGAQKDIDAGVLESTRLKWPYNFFRRQSDNQSRSFIENSDIVVVYMTPEAPTNFSLFTHDSFLGKHAKKIIVEGNEIDDVSQVESIIYKMFSNYEMVGYAFSVEFILDTDTVEGDLFGIDYKHSEEKYAFPAYIAINTKIKSLHFENLAVIIEAETYYTSLNLWNSKTEIFENGIITGVFDSITLPYTLKDIKPNAFGRYIDEDGENVQTAIKHNMQFLAPVVPLTHERVDVYLEGSVNVSFPALLNVEYDYIDYVTNSFEMTERAMSGVLMFSNERNTPKQ